MKEASRITTIIAIVLIMMMIVGIVKSEYSAEIKKNQLKAREIIKNNAEVQEMALRRQEAEGKRTKKAEEPLKIAFVFVGPLNDLGWSFAHNEGRVYLDHKPEYAGLIKTYAYPAISDDIEICTEFFNALLLEKEWDMVVGTSFGFQYPMYELTKLFPGTHFLHISGFLQDFENPANTPSNWGLGFGKIHHARYLTGYLLGLMGVTHLGNIAAVPIPETFNGVNALYAGLKDANPEARLSVVWANQWVKPDLEEFQAQYLINVIGVDGLAQDTDAHEPQFVASVTNIPSVGYNTDGQRFISNTVLTSAIWNWGPLYAHFLDKILNNVWVFEDLWADMTTGVPTVAYPSPIVPDAVKLVFEQKVQEFLSGEISEVFCGKWAEWWTPPGNDTLLPNGCMNNFQILAQMWSLHPDITDLGYIPIPETRVDISEGMIVAMQILAAISLCISAVSLVLIIVYRNKNAIRYSSPTFCVISVLGALMMVIAVFLLSPMPATKALCTSVIWVVAVGFGMFFAGLIVKTWRIALIFRKANQYRTVAVSNAQLMIPTIMVVLVEVILCIILTAVDTPYPEKTTNYTPELAPYHYRVVCTYENVSLNILYALIAYNGTLLAIGVILTFQTRALSRQFNESKHLSVAIYAYSFCFAILIPLIAITDDIEARYLLASLGIIISVTTAVLAIFAPKFYIICRGKDSSLSPSAASTTVGGRKLGTVGGTSPHSSTPRTTTAED